MSDLVLFSGGCDSTLVLYNQSMELLKAGQSYKKIKALSINHYQIPSQMQQQLARKKIQEEFIARQLPVEWIDISITCNSDIGSSGLIQPAIWIANALLYLDNGDILYAGYHKGDDYWFCRDKAEIAFNSFSSIIDKQCFLKYPLQFWNKSDIIEELKERKLYDLCWYCETLAITDKPCGECIPCKTHRTALWQLDNFKSSLTLPSKHESKEKDCMVAIDTSPIIRGS